MESGEVQVLHHITGAGIRLRWAVQQRRGMHDADHAAKPVYGEDSQPHAGDPAQAGLRSVVA